MPRRFPFFIALFLGCFFHTVAVAETLLQTTIQTIPTGNPHSTKEQVQPGTKMQLQASVKNVGTAANQAGTLSIRFAFPEPLSNTPNNLIFETENRELPILAPGEEVVITFKKMHQWPTLFNFVRDDWAMREYQAVTQIDGKKTVIGALTVAFSAYYYEGIHLNTPVSVSSR